MIKHCGVKCWLGLPWAAISSKWKWITDEPSALNTRLILFECFKSVMWYKHENKDMDPNKTEKII